LTYKAQALGYTPQVILAGRRINDSMGEYVAYRTLKLMALRGMTIAGSKILILGFTFKENCPDVRNTRVIDIVGELRGLGCTVDVFDPVADVNDTRRLYGIELVEHPVHRSYNTIILAVAHDIFIRDQAFSPRSYGKDGCVVFDVKGALPRETVDGRL